VNPEQSFSIRNEGNLFIDVYEVILGKPAHKFMAVPNLLFQEADKKYFGVGDSKIEALKDCLRKIKDVPITEIVPTETSDEPQANSLPIAKPSNGLKTSTALRKISGAFSRRKKESMRNGL